MEDQAASRSEAATEEDDLHRKFREALERKKAERHDSHGPGAQGKGVGPAFNDKRQRQFRRKSG
jgi:adenylosuccinate synthase